MTFRGARNSATPPMLGHGGSASASETPSVDEDPQSPAQLLEIAAATADELVADAKAEAASLVASARAQADGISEATRTEADRAAAELGRMKSERTAELERERVATLAGLEQEKADLERAIARLRHLQEDQRRQLRDHLDEQLRLLDAAVPEPPREALD